ncbi:MAG: hypothetical protein WCA35_25085 [Kovacikia sp.]
MRLGGLPIINTRRHANYLEGWDLCENSLPPAAIATDRNSPLPVHRATSTRIT